MCKDKGENIQKLKRNVTTRVTFDCQWKSMERWVGTQNFTEVTMHVLVTHV